MDRFDERLLDRDLEELLGGEKPSDLSGRILATPRTVRSSRRLPQGATSAPVWIGVAAAFALVVVFALRSQDAPPRRPVAPSPAVARDPAPSIPEAKPPEVTPPEKPPVPPPQPARPEEAKKPPVETPKIEPPSQPKKPAVVVEAPPPPPKPAPATTVERRAVATILARPKGNPLRLRYADGEAWRDAGDEALFAGAEIQCARPADLTLTGGARLRFEGSLRLEAQEGTLAIEIRDPKTAGWCDNLGCKAPVTVSSQGLKVRMDDAAALFEAAPLALNLSCFHGTLRAGDAGLPAGQFAPLGAKGLGKNRALSAAERSPRLLAGMTPRRLMREEFDAASAGKIRDGRIEDGILQTKGSDTRVGAAIKPAIVALPKAALRMRYRVSACESLYMQLLGTDVTKQYGIYLAQAAGKQGQWQELELRLDSIPYDLNRSGPGRPTISLGLELGLFQCYVNGEKDCTLQIDWLEFVRLNE